MSCRVLSGSCKASVDCKGLFTGVAGLVVGVGLVLRAPFLEFRAEG